MNCSISGCTSTVKGYRGFCNAHYLRWLRHGDPLGSTPRKRKGLCNELECGRPHQAKGKCRYHYSVELYQARGKINHHRFDRTVKGRFSSGKQSAARRGLSWEISFEDYESLLKDPQCHYRCGNEIAPTGCALDRLDSLKGYTLDNVVVCCAICNKSRRRDFTPEEWGVMISALVSFRNK